MKNSFAKLVTVFALATSVFLVAPLTATALDSPIIPGQHNPGWDANSVNQQLEASQNELKASRDELATLVPGAPEHALRHSFLTERVQQIQKDIAYLEELDSSFDLVAKVENGQITQADLNALSDAAWRMQELEQQTAYTFGSTSATDARTFTWMRQVFGKGIYQLQGDTKRAAEMDRKIAAHKQDIASGRLTDLDAKAVKTGEFYKNLGSEVECFSVGGGFNVEGCLILTTATIGNYAAYVTSSVLWLANQIFNLSFDISVRRFGEFTGSSGVKEAWGIIRDLVNISLVFILLYAALALILQLQKVDARRLVTHVIIAALLVNFSAFLVGVVIEGSNTLANQFYTAAAGGYQTSNGAPDISSRLTSEIAFTDAKVISTQGLANTFIQTAVAALGQVLLHIITIVSLIAGAIAMLVRTIALLLVIIFAPAAFVMPVLPWFNKYYETWRDALLKHAIFAPLFLFCLLAATTLVSAGAFAPAGGITVNLTEAGMAQTAQSVMFVLLVNFLMLGGLLISQKLGVYGAGGAVGILKGMGNKTRGWLGRNSAGRLASMANKRLDKAGSAMMGNQFGRGLLLTSKLFGGNVLKGKIEEAATKKTYGGSVSFTQAQDDRKKDIEEAMKKRRGDPKAMAGYISSFAGLGSAVTDDTKLVYEKLGLRERVEVGKHLNPRLKEELDKHIIKENKKKGVDEGAKIMKAERDAQREEMEAENEQAFKKAQKEGNAADLATAAEKLTPKQLENMTYEELEAAVGTGKLSEKQFKAIADRKEGLTAPQIKTLTDKQKEVEIKKAEAEISTMSSAEFEALAKKDKFKGDAAAVQRFQAAREKPLRDALDPGHLDPPAVQTYLSRLSPTEISNLSDDVLSNPLVIRRLTPRELSEIVGNKNRSTEALKKMKRVSQEMRSQTDARDETFTKNQSAVAKWWREHPSVKDLT